MKINRWLIYCWCLALFTVQRVSASLATGYTLCQVKPRGYYRLGHTLLFYAVLKSDVTAIFLIGRN